MVCEWEMHEQISNLLIQAGADKHALVGHMSPLYSVSAGGTAPVVRLLLRQGVNPVIQASYKLASLHWAAANGYFEVVKILFEAGADKLCILGLWGIHGRKSGNTFSFVALWSSPLLDDVQVISLVRVRCLPEPDFQQ